MEGRKVVLITGCSSGFGYLTALKFARNRYQTFAGVRNLESPGAKKLEELKIQEDLQLEVLKIDVTDNESVRRGVEAILRQEKRIDILINNAGFGTVGPVEEFSLDEIKDQYETNVYGVLRMIKAVAPTMRAQKSGHIINISSIAGLVTFPLYGLYSSSKRALEGLTEDLRFDLSHFGIKVVLVEHGSFGTSFSQNRKTPQSLTSQNSPYKDLAEKFNNRYRKFQKKVFAQDGDPQKVADLIYRIANQSKPAARYLVGNDACLYYYLRRFVPNFLWEYLLH